MEFQIYLDQAEEWRWRLVAANGQIIACSGEGYINKHDCYHALGLLNKVCGNQPAAPIVEPDHKDD